MESNFVKLHEELCGLRQEIKEEIDLYLVCVSWTIARVENLSDK